VHDAARADDALAGSRRAQANRQRVDVVGPAHTSGARMRSVYVALERFETRFGGPVIEKDRLSACAGTVGRAPHPSLGTSVCAASPSSTLAVVVQPAVHTRLVAHWSRLCRLLVLADIVSLSRSCQTAVREGAYTASRQASHAPSHRVSAAAESPSDT
jgi:hypothetical protein